MSKVVLFLMISLLATDAAGIAQSSPLLKDSIRPTEDQATRERLRNPPGSIGDFGIEDNADSPLKPELNDPTLYQDAPIETEDENTRERLKNSPTRKLIDNTDLPGIHDGPDPSPDPDTSAELKTAWVIWHKNVEQQIQKRFKEVAQKHFHAQTLACRLVYSISINGRISNIRVIERSPGSNFHWVALMALNSMKESPILEFPKGSGRRVVEKSSTFKLNSR
jgi:hypothetical protein